MCLFSAPFFRHLLVSAINSQNRPASHFRFPFCPRFQNTRRGWFCHDSHGLICPFWFVFANSTPRRYTSIAVARFSSGNIDACCAPPLGLIKKSDLSSRRFLQILSTAISPSANAFPDLFFPEFRISSTPRRWSVPVLRSPIPCQPSRNRAQHLPFCLVLVVSSGKFHSVYFVRDWPPVWKISLPSFVVGRGSFSLP